MLAGQAYRQREEGRRLHRARELVRSKSGVGRLLEGHGLIMLDS